MEKISKETANSLLHSLDVNGTFSCTFSDPIFPKDGRNDVALVVKSVVIEHDGFKTSYQICHFLWIEGLELQQKLIRSSYTTGRERIKEVEFEIDKAKDSCYIRLEYPYNGPCGIGGYGICTNLRRLKEGD